MQYYHDSTQAHNSQPILLKYCFCLLLFALFFYFLLFIFHSFVLTGNRTVERMMQALKSQAVHNKMLDLNSSLSTSTLFESSSISSSSQPTDNNNNNKNTNNNKRTISEVHKSKVQKYTEWATMISNMNEDTNKVVEGIRENKWGWNDDVGERDKKHLEKCVAEIGSQIKDDITKNLKASRASRSIFNIFYYHYYCYFIYYC